MYTGVRRRDRQVAVLRSLGADRRWLVHAEFWQASSSALVPAAVGIPAGFIVGRYVFGLFADHLGVVEGAAAPMAFTAAVVGVLALVSIVAAVAAGHRSRRIAPALLVRTG